MSKPTSAERAASHIADDAVAAVNPSSGLYCTDAVLAALGKRFDDTGHPRNLTSIHAIAAGDFFGTKGVDLFAKLGCFSKIIGGSYPSGPTKAEPPLIWHMITGNQVKAYNVPSGIVFDMLREGAGQRPGVLTKVGMDTFVAPELKDCATNGVTRSEPIVERRSFDGEDWLCFRAQCSDVAIIRATASGQKGNPARRRGSRLTR